MRIPFFLSTVLVFAHLTTNCQTQSSIDKMIAMVKNVPTKHAAILSDRRVVNNFDPKEDVWYGTIKHYDTSVIKFLINLIADTTDTEVRNSCSKEKYKIGDIAVLLINDIEQIPYATVTNTQWCLPSICGTLPEGFIHYVNSDRQKFKIAYEEYYYSNTRQSIIKTKRHT